ncbi:MAG: hypothetical protein ABI380_01750 [Edaphobacter sp.]
MSFADASQDPQSVIDDAYRKKYTKSPYLAPMLGVRARSATVVIEPRYAAN